MSDYEIVYSDDPNFKKRCPKVPKVSLCLPKGRSNGAGQSYAEKSVWKRTDVAGKQ